MMTEPSNYNRGPSKIPKFNPATHQHVQNMDNDYQKPSRLQQLQADYQQKLMREKQQKLIQMYEDNQQRTMNRLQSKGLVRDFFSERRTLESNLNKTGITQMPSINQHYKQRKLHQPENFNEQWVQRPNQRQNSYSKMYGKNSAGRDRANPLAPIEKRPGGKENNSSAPPLPRKAQKHGRPWTKESQKTESNFNDAYTPKSAPIMTRQSPAESNDSTPPPNLAQLKSLQKQKIHMKRQNTMETKTGRPPKPPAQQKMTDFQKWQMEQDNARAERLKQLHGDENDDYDNTEDSGLDSDEKDELQAEIERKQKELMSKIAEQEAELERIRRERQEEEEEERREMERRRKKEEERRRKQREEEERRRILEAEAEERQRREEEEEFKRKLMQTERIKAVYEPEPQYNKADYTTYQSTDDEEDTPPHNYYNNNRSGNNSRSQYNQPDNRSRSNYNQPDNKSRPHYNRPDNSSRSQYNRTNNSSRTQNNRMEPTPPPQPKPVKVVRKQPKRDSPPILDYNNSHPNQKLNTDTSMYDQAAHDPDAYPDTQIHLAPCPNCGRKFDSERLRKHRNACGNLTKKRKVMDPTKMRMQGTDFEKYQNSRKREEPKPKPSNWKRKHEEFVQNIRYARKVAQIEKEGGNLAALPPPPKAENPDYVPCPYCNRKFNSTAAERHIPRCKDLKTRPAPMRR